MKKTKIILTVSLLVILFLCAGYFYFLKKTPERKHSDVSNETESAEKQKTHDEIAARLGIPGEPGMTWNVTKEKIQQGIGESGIDFKKLKVYDIHSNVNEAYIENLRKLLGLPDDCTELFLSAGNCFSFEKTNTTCKITEKELEAISKKIRVGVWQGEKGYGTIREQKEGKLGTENFYFDGLPWKEDMYGNSLDQYGDLLYGIESEHSLAWDIEDGVLKRFSGFSYEIKPKKLKNAVASKEQLTEFVWSKVEPYIKQMNQYEKTVSGDVTPFYTLFEADEITVSMTYENVNAEEDKAQFVPVVELNGTVYNYDFGDKMWENYKGGYAISLESGGIYDWRTDKQ